jgi:hypothetical protein
MLLAGLVLGDPILLASDNQKARPGGEPRHCYDRRPGGSRTTAQQDLDDRLADAQTRRSRAPVTSKRL